MAMWKWLAWLLGETPEHAAPIVPSEQPLTGKKMKQKTAPTKSAKPVKPKIIPKLKRRPKP